MLYNLDCGEYYTVRRYEDRSHHPGGQMCIGKQRFYYVKGIADIE